MLEERMLAIDNYYKLEEVSIPQDIEISMFQSDEKYSKKRISGRRMNRLIFELFNTEKIISKDMCVKYVGVQK